MSASHPLRHALEQPGSLPPIPRIAQKILSLKINSDEGERGLLELIKQDPPILSKIVGLANSPLFGSARKIVSLHDAAAILGSKRIKMIALSFAMMSAMSRKTHGRFDIQGLWLHSLCVAMAMDSLARHMPSERCPADDELYLSGLLHDIGFLVLDYIDPSLSDSFHERLSALPKCTVEEIEAEMLKTSHGELGAELARHWGLPENIVAVLNFHHCSEEKKAAVGQPLVTMTHLAERLLPTFGLIEPVTIDINDDEWLTLGIAPQQGEEIKTKIHGHIQDVAENIS